MTTESETKLARYSKVERESDAFGRVIGVRRMRPSEQVKITGMTSDLAGYDEETVTDEATGEVNMVRFPRRLSLFLASAVCEIDDVKLALPINRSQLDAILDRLDREGIAAAGKAFARLSAVEELATVDSAKN
jgi:hypothetical protein